MLSVWKHKALAQGDWASPFYNILQDNFVCDDCQRKGGHSKIESERRSSSCEWINFQKSGCLLWLSLAGLLESVLFFVSEREIFCFIVPSPWEPRENRVSFMLMKVKVVIQFSGCANSFFQLPWVAVKSLEFLESFLLFFV